MTDNINTDDTSFVPSYGETQQAINPDIANLIGGYQGQSNNPTPTFNDLFNFTPSMSPQEEQAYNDYHKAQSNPVGNSTNADYFPGYSDNINKGYYSGSEIGSVPIFTPNGGLFPLGVVDDRQRNLKMAAAQKAKDISKFRSTFIAPTTKHTAVQGQLDDAYYTGLNKWVNNAQKTYGENWPDALQNDVQFQKWQKGMETIKTMEDGVTNYVAHLEDKEKGGNYVLSPETKNAISEFHRGLHGITTNPFDPQGHEFNNKILKMRAEANLDDVVNDSVKGLIQDVKESNPNLDSKGIYDILSSTKTTYTSPEKIDQLAEGIMKTHYGYDSMFSKKDVVSRLKSILGTKVERDFKTATNQFSPDRGDGLNDVYTKQDFDSPEKSQTINIGGTTEGHTVKNSSITAYDGVTFKKPIKVNIPAGTKMYNIDKSANLQGDMKGVKNIVLGKMQNVLVIDNPGKANDGVIVPPDYKTNEIWSNFKDLNSKYIPMVSGRVMSTEAGKEVPKESVMIPVDNVANALVKRDVNGNIISGIPVDEAHRLAAERNVQLGNNTSQQQSQKTTISKYPLPAGKQRTVKQGGHTYTWNEQTGQYE